MNPKAKTLRQYQEKLVYNVCRTTDDALVEQPTGSGKTIEIVTLVAMHLGRRFTHAVISAPQEQIEQGFVTRDYNVVAFPQRRGVAVPSIQVPKHTILGARDSKDNECWKMDMIHVHTITDVVADGGVFRGLRCRHE